MCIRDRNASKAEEGVDIDGKPADTIGKPADKPSGGNANASGSNTGNSNSGNAGGSHKPSTPAHQHSWTQHTAQRWVSNMVTVPDYETQTVYGARFYVPTGTPGQYIAKGPEYWFENGFTRDDLNAIIVNALRNADENGLYNGVDYSSYQNIKKTVQVQVCLLYTSGTVTTEPTATKEGVRTYTCTKCGATKTETVAALGTSTEQKKQAQANGSNGSNAKTGAKNGELPKTGDNILPFLATLAVSLALISAGVFMERMRASK